MNVSPFIKMNYEQLTMSYEIKNEPKTNPNEPNFKGKKPADMVIRRKEKGQVCGKIENLESLSVTAELIGKQDPNQAKSRAGDSGCRLPNPQVFRRKEIARSSKIEN